MHPHPDPPPANLPTTGHRTNGRSTGVKDKRPPSMRCPCCFAVVIPTPLIALPGKPFRFHCNPCNLQGLFLFDNGHTKLALTKR